MLGGTLNTPFARVSIFLIKVLLPLNEAPDTIIVHGDSNLTTDSCSDMLSELIESDWGCDGRFILRMVNKAYLENTADRPDHGSDNRRRHCV